MKHLIFSIFILTLPPIFTCCKTTCSTIDIRYPFAVDDGCGAPQFRSMFNCSSDQSLFFTTPSGSYKVQNIDYQKHTLEIYDPSMSTCSILQPHHDFIMTPLQSYLIPPSPDTVFALLNCSIDSPVLNHYKDRCFDFSGHSCHELYSSCNAFKLFNFPTNTNISNTSNTSNGNGNGNGNENGNGNGSPPCCFTGYDTVKFMSMNILDCTHYTSVINSDDLRGVGPLDWVYGIKLSYNLPDTGCQRCLDSGGTCGFDTETEGLLCLCSASSNATRECGVGSITGGGARDQSPMRIFHVFVMVLSVLFLIFGLW